MEGTESTVAVTRPEVDSIHRRGKRVVKTALSPSSDLQSETQGRVHMDGDACGH